MSLAFIPSKEFVRTHNRQIFVAACSMFPSSHIVVTVLDLSACFFRFMLAMLIYFSCLQINVYRMSGTDRLPVQRLILKIVEELTEQL